MIEPGLRKPGEIDILELSLQSRNGITIDLFNFYANITINENMFNNVINGHITLSETYNFPETIPITGCNEFLHIRYRTSGMTNDIKKTFMVYKISKRLTKRGSPTQAYNLYFVSYEQVLSSRLSISRSYTGKISNIVKQIYNQYLLSDDIKYKNSLFLSDSLYQTKIIIPNLSPLRAINWLTSRSIADNSNHGSDYVFYETSDGFHFKSISGLFSNRPVQDYFYGAITNLKDKNIGVDDLDKTYKNVMKYDIYKSELYETIDSGALSSTLLTYDINKKKLNKQSYDYIDDFYKSKSLENHPIIPKNIKTVYLTNKQTLLSKDSYSYTSYPQSGSNGYDVDDYFLRRISQISQISSTKINIRIYGDSNRKLGDIVTFSVPPATTTEERLEKYDKFLNGKFLITGITHLISRVDYHMNLELSKDSYFSPLPDTNVLE